MNHSTAKSIVVKSFQSKKQVNSQSKGNRIPVLSFFTGAGFLDMGFQSAGFDVIWHNEHEPRFIESFEYAMSNMAPGSFGGHVENTLSIEGLSASTIAKQAFHNTPRPSVFGIIGGPPCPDFSVGGKNHGSEGDHGRLSLTFVELISELKPTFFLFENVPGLLHTAKHREFLLSLMRRLMHAYEVDVRILNALEFGVPQDRQRVFLIGVRRNWAKVNLASTGSRPSGDWYSKVRLRDSKSLDHVDGWPDWFPWRKYRKYQNAKSNFTWPGVSKFGGHPRKPARIPYELMVYKWIGNTREIENLPNGLDCFRPHSAKFLTIQEGDVSRKSFKRLHRYRYSPAAAYGNNEVHLHPVLARRLSVREALRLQTVPDSYILPAQVPLTHKFKTVGNGVPVELAKAVALSFRDLLSSR